MIVLPAPSAPQLGPRDFLVDLAGAVLGLATLAAFFCLGWNELGFAQAVGVARIGFFAAFGGAVALASAVRVVAGPAGD